MVDKTRETSRPIGEDAGRAVIPDEMLAQIATIPRPQNEDLRPAVAGGAAQSPTKSRPSRASTLRVRGGKREMKGYALTKQELWTVGGLQGGSAASFSIAGMGFGLWISTQQQIQFAAAAKPQILGYWQGVADMAFYGMIGFAILGAALFFLSGFNVVKIIKATEHD
jgi:hypothetical protein